PEPQGVEQRDWARPHRDHISEDAADSCRRPLVGLDGAGMVVRLDLEDNRPALADVHSPCVFARALKDARALRRKLAQQRLRRFESAGPGPDRAALARL